MNTHTLPIIAYHRSPLTQKFGIPRQPNLVAIKSQIHFIAPFGTPDAFVGIERYSHLWVLWHFHQNKHQSQRQDKCQNQFRAQVRPPRLGGNDKMGVFATRSMYRPSELGLSVVAFERMQIVAGQVILHIRGADMADGTPIFDVKPYLPFVDSVPQAISGDIDKPLIKSVIFTDGATVQLQQHVHQGDLLPQDKAVIIDLIAQDPRPAYRQDEIGVVHSMRYKALDVDFMMDECGVLMVCQVRQV